MIKKIIITVLISIGHFTLHAQDLSDCENPCKKTKIVQTGPFIGLRTIDLADSMFVRVIEVVKRSASYKNGILLDDTLTHFNGKPILSMKYFIGEVAKLNPGDTITLTVIRKGEISDYRYPLGALQTKRVTVIECCDTVPVLNNIIFVLSLDPKQENLRISAYENIPYEVELKILDANGEILKTETANKSKVNFEASIDISDLASGQYFVKIFVEKTQYVHRFTKE